MWRSLIQSGHIAAKATRFAGVGVMSGLIYAIVTALLVSGIAVNPTLASIGGYCAAIPLNFVGHRQFSFRSRGRLSFDMLRFVVAQAINIAVTAGAMYAVTAWFGAAYWWGMIAAVILVPVANFAFMNLWVFRNQKHNLEAAL